jgi:hypothetical protein
LNGNGGERPSNRGLRTRIPGGGRPAVVGFGKVFVAEACVVFFLLDCDFKFVMRTLKTFTGCQCNLCNIDAKPALEVSSSGPVLSFRGVDGRDSTTSNPTDRSTLKEMLNSNILITLPESTSCQSFPRSSMIITAHLPKIKIRLLELAQFLQTFLATCYQCNNHGIQIEEEHDQMKSQLDKTLLLVTVKSPEDFRGIKHMLSV